MPRRWGGRRSRTCAPFAIASISAPPRRARSRQPAPAACAAGSAGRVPWRHSVNGSLSDGIESLVLGEVFPGSRHARLGKLRLAPALRIELFPDLASPEDHLGDDFE